MHPLILIGAFSMVVGLMLDGVKMREEKQIEGGTHKPAKPAATQDETQDENKETNTEVESEVETE